LGIRKDTRVFQVDQERRAKFEQDLEDGLSPYDAAIAAGYCARYARQLASTGPLSVEGLIAFGWAQIRNRKNSDRVRQRYWERLGEHYGLWGTGRKPPAGDDDRPKAGGFVIRDVPHNGEGAEE
jgi:hypothetical protein